MSANYTGVNAGGQYCQHYVHANVYNCARSNAGPSTTDSTSASTIAIISGSNISHSLVDRNAKQITVDFSTGTSICLDVIAFCGYCYQFK